MARTRAGIPVLTLNKTKFRASDYYEIAAAQFTQQLHPAIPTTTLWGYADSPSKNHRYLDGVIVATRGTPVKLKVDPTLLDPPIVAEVAVSGFGAASSRALSLASPERLLGPAFIEIGTEGGFPPAPVIFTKDGSNKLSIPQTAT